VKGGHGWAGVDSPGHGEWQGFRRRPLFFFPCVDLHVISNTPVLTGMEHGLQFAWTYWHEGLIINIE